MSGLLFERAQPSGALPRLLEIASSPNWRSLVDREITVRPTLRVREGAPVRVLVTRDIELRAYGGRASHE